MAVEFVDLNRPADVGALVVVVVGERSFWRHCFVVVVVAVNDVDDRSTVQTLDLKVKTLWRYCCPNLCNNIHLHFIRHCFYTALKHVVKKKTSLIQ